MNFVYNAYMNELMQMLEVVDENDNVVGLENRTKVHKEGLLHREIHIWFITPQGEIIFQHRAKDKDTYPDKLDATVGGHVEPNTSYEETAVKECKEETGIDIDPSKLLFLAKLRSKSFDEATGLTNNVIRSQYAYLYEGSISDLQIEEGKSEGFEAWKIDDLPNLSEQDKSKFIGLIISDEMQSLFKKAKEELIK
jgi:isopentenyldiphosphate isomerase